MLNRYPAQGQLASGDQSLRRPLDVLLLCHFYPVGTTLEHIRAFARFSRNRIYTLSNLGELPPWLDLSRFDALIVHYTLAAALDNYLSPDARRRIREFRGFKAAFVQDDYRWVNDTVDTLAYLRIHALFPLAGPEIMDQVYSPERLPGVRRETVLTGYVPEDLARRAVPPLAARPLDVGYRARSLPAWIGSHTLQKWQIAERFGKDASRYGLKVDLSCREEDRIYGEAWIDFIASCKATLGTESGASVCDFTGEIQRNVEAHLKRMPDTTFEVLRDLYFKAEDGRILMNVISPRCFEAAALRTLMILYEGQYSGVLEPWRHYVPLRRDHGNMDEVVRILRDPVAAQKIVDRAHEEIALNPNYTYRAMVEKVDRVIEEGYQPAMAALALPYGIDEFAWRTSDQPGDATDMASVDSALAFELDAPLAGVLENVANKRPATTLAGLPLPHVIEVNLPIKIRIRTIRLVWADGDSAPMEGALSLFAGEKTVAAITPLCEAPGIYREYRFRRPVRADRIRLRVDRYCKGNRFRLRDLRIDSSESASTRQRRLKRSGMPKRIRAQTMRALWLVWVHTPAWIRAILRAPARRLVRIFSSPAK